MAMLAREPYVLLAPTGAIAARAMGCIRTPAAQWEQAGWHRPLLFPPCSGALLRPIALAVVAPGASNKTYSALGNLAMPKHLHAEQLT